MLQLFVRYSFSALVLPARNHLDCEFPIVLEEAVHYRGIEEVAEAYRGLVRKRRMGNGAVSLHHDTKQDEAGDPGCRRIPTSWRCVMVVYPVFPCLIISFEPNSDGTRRYYAQSQ
jgi:hypothetical protein